MELKYIIILATILLILQLIFDSINRLKTDNARSNKIMSSSERQIASFLDKKNIKYKLQYTYRNCRDKKCLPFDFAILNEKGGVAFLIEYDGEQHFEPVNFNGEGKKKAKENFKKCQKHDKIKDRYCKRHHIDLVRISYKERKNMYKIITKKLYEYNLL